MGMEVIKAQTGTVDVTQISCPDKISRQDKMMSAGVALHHQFDIIRANSVGEYYWKEHEGKIFQYLDEHRLRTWVRDFWLEAYGGLTPKDLTDGCEIVKILTKDEVENLSLDNIMISDNLYWDRENGEVVRTPNAPVFFRLFDTTVETKHVVKIPDFTKEQEERLLERYEQVKAELQRGEEVERYEFLKTWANGSHDVYMDLHRAHAYMFLKKKPLGAYILIGLKRNGKSSYIGLTHSIAGGNNSSNVQLTQLGDPHYTHMLRTTLLNAPDEEEDKSVSAQGFFKGLPLDTLIPNPSGYTTMGELQVGDYVYDKDFRAVKVLHKSSIHHNPCYKISFRNGESIIADHEHRWLAQVGQKNRAKEKVYTTEELASLIKTKRIRIYNPVDKSATPDVELPIDPYVLGCWLGDGCKQWGEIAKPLPTMWAEIQRRGYKISPNRNKDSRKCEKRTIYGLRPKLKALGLIQNKHLPMIYLRASRKQRLDLLKGLMDTDGFYAPNNTGRDTGGTAKMSTTQTWQRDAVLELVSSLGWTPSQREVYRIGFGKKVKVYDVEFTPTEDVFLARNVGVKYANPAFGACHRLIKKIEPVETVPTQCIEVDSESHTYLFGKGHIVTHNTMADHSTLSLPVMRSNVPIQLNCDFMCFFPMNHTPEWTGSGAAACMDRSLIIPFNADLSHYDKTSGNFAKDTFTSDMMADYLGSVFAYAWWYHRHDFDFSETMRTEQGVLEQDLDSCLTYYKRFTRYFDGFETFKTVYTDYQLWCQAQDVKINTRKELKFVFRAICNSKSSWRNKVDYYPKRQTTLSVYRIPDGKQPLMNDFVPSEKGIESLKTLHEKNCSIIDRLDVYYAARGVE